jgi:mRNA-degrading endonuclease RelE of RelBE toxin-antitoxin system
MTFQTTPTFEADFRQLKPDEAKQAREKLKLLASNLYHPSLRVKKMRGKPGERGIYRMRVNRSLRITFTLQEDTVILRRVGGHDDTIHRP